LSSPGRDLVKAFETSSFSPAIGIEPRIYAMLPPRDEVVETTVRAQQTALICHECLDNVDYLNHLDKLYISDPEDYEAGDRSFLTLVYAVVALGRRFLPSTIADEVDVSSDTVKFRG
jgi:hypothetical protein